MIPLLTSLLSSPESDDDTKGGMSGSVSESIVFVYSMPSGWSLKQNGYGNDHHQQQQQHQQQQPHRPPTHIDDEDDEDEEEDEHEDCDEYDEDDEDE